MRPPPQPCRALKSPAFIGLRLSSVEMLTLSYKSQVKLQAFFSVDLPDSLQVIKT